MYSRSLKFYTEDLDCMLQCPENESATLDNSESHIGLSLCRCHNALLLHRHKSSESAKATRFRSQRCCRASNEISIFGANGELPAWTSEVS